MRGLSETVMHVVFGCIAGLTIVLLIGIFALLLRNGYQAVREIGLPSMLGADWNPVSYVRPSWGMSGLLLGTAMVAGSAIFFALPLGLLTAISLSELMPPRLREFLKPMIELIAGLPSVVLGILGLLYVAPLIARTFGLSNGLNALTAGLLVAIAVLPSIASLCEDAIGEVPRTLREASLALGATKWTTIVRVVIPTAKSGIAAAIMLGLGRAIGETVIVLMVAGNSLAVPRSFLDPVRPVTANIAIEIKEVVFGSLHWSSLCFAGLLLFLLTFAINAVTDLFIQRHKHA
ncbi:phosphate ABC transporter permease subunit PstC [Candidatus Peregrinibacteria bacterium]|nr:phosphate ABC transporter permease subunit PstC [Candidatus Peregrinibacteria bacterium]